MNIQDIFLRLLNEQKWREKKAQEMSSGLGSMPYNFDEQMGKRAPGLLEQFRKDDEAALKQQLQLQADQPPDWFLERYLLNQMSKRNKEDRERLNSPL